MERKSKGRLFHNALTLLVIGLILIFFYINVEGSDIASYTAWIGCGLLAAGLWMLRKENKQISHAFGFAALFLLMRIAFYWLGVFPLSETIIAVSTFLFIVSNITILIMMYFLFTGLRNVALKFGDAQLAIRLIRCFVLYVSLYGVLLVCFILPVLIVPAIIYGIFVLIKLPLTLNQLGKHIPFDTQDIIVKPLNKWSILIVSLYIAINIGGQFGFMYYVNAPRPEAVPFVNEISPVTVELRERLVYLGMPENVLSDLPDDEIRQFEGIYDANVNKMDSSVIVNRDGGELEVISFIGFMPEGKVRTLFYYHWREPPSNAFIDMLSIACPLDHYTMLGDSGEKGLSLFDKDGTSYRQTLLNEGNLVGNPQLNEANLVANFQFTSLFSHINTPGFTTQILFRLYPQYENQRGYVAVNALVSRPDEVLGFSSNATYVHQESVWNRPHFSPLNQTAPYGYMDISFIKGSEAFWSEWFY